MCDDNHIAKIAKSFRNWTSRNKLKNICKETEKNKSAKTTSVKIQPMIWPLNGSLTNYSFDEKTSQTFFIPFLKNLMCTVTVKGFRWRARTKFAK